MNDHPTTSTDPTPPSAVALSLYAAVLAGDADGARPFAVADVTLDVPGTHALAGRHVGVDAIVAFALASRAATDDGEHIEILDVLDGREHAALSCRITATRPGRPPLDNHTIHLAHVADGRVDHIWIHNRDDVTTDAFWR